MVQATLASGAVASNDAANYSFTPDVISCILAVRAWAVPLLIRINVGTLVANEASTTNYEYVVSAAGIHDLSLERTRLINSVSIYVDGLLSTTDYLLWGLPQ